MLDANPTLGNREETKAGTLRIKRARYSALTKEEIERAFNELDELSYPLANAGAARQDIDLLWGATLTRAVSLSHPPLRLQLPLGRPRAEPDPGPDRRARDGAPRPRRQTLLGTVRQVRAPRRQLRDPPRDRQVLGEGRGRRGPRRHHRPGHGQVGDGAQEHAQAADALQHDRLHHRRLQPPRHHPRQRDAPRRGPLHGRLHLLPAYRQHRLPGLAAAARAGHLAGQGQGVLRRLRPARRRAEADPRQKRDDRPPADLPDPGDPARRPRRRPQEARLRTGRAPLPRHLQPADDHRVDPRRHRRPARRPTSSAARSSSTPASPASTPTPAPPTRRSRRCRRARRCSSTASPGSSTRRPSRPRGSRRRSWSR